MLLTKYYKYVNDEILTESNVKPDPPGYKEATTSLNYRDKFNKIINDIQGKAKKITADIQTKATKEIDEILEKSKKDISDLIIKQLEEDLKGRLICMTDDNGRQRILRVNKVSEVKSGGNYYPLIIESDDKKIKYNWDNDAKSRIFKMDAFLEYFEEHFLDQLVAFQGKPTKGGQEARYIKHIMRIGIYGGTNQDNAIVETDDGTQLLLMHQHPIKIMDMRLKHLDPYGEENWEE